MRYTRRIITPCFSGMQVLEWTIYVSTPVTLRPPQAGLTGTEEKKNNRIRPRTGIMEYPSTATPFHRHDSERIW